MVYTGWGTQPGTTLPGNAPPSCPACTVLSTVLLSFLEVGLVGASSVLRAPSSGPLATSSAASTEPLRDSNTFATLFETGR